MAHNAKVLAVRQVVACLVAQAVRQAVACLVAQAVRQVVAQ